MPSPAGTPVTALTTGLASDPAALLTALGDRNPVHRVTLPDGMPSVLVTGNAEARQALSDPRLVRSISAADPELHRYHPLASDDYPLSRHMLFADPPDHARMRRVVSRAFTRRRVDELRPRIRQIADELIDGFVGAGHTDLVESFALPLPIAVISEMLGIPLDDRADFERHAETLTGINASSGFDDIIAAGRWFDGYLAELVERRRQRPGSDLLSAMVVDGERSEQLTDLELRSNALLLLSAGFETTVNLIANGTLALLSHPGAAAALRAEPGLMSAAVEELMRHDSPVSCITYHFARERLEVGGVEVQQGEHVVISVTAANHDPAAFPEPERLDLRRDPGPLLSFSHGIHFCLGAPLARAEGEIAFDRLLRRLPGLRLAVAEQALQWKPSFVLHRLASLPVAFGPEC